MENGLAKEKNEGKIPVKIKLNLTGELFKFVFFFYMKNQPEAK